MDAFNLNIPYSSDESVASTIGDSQSDPDDFSSDDESIASAISCQ